MCVEGRKKKKQPDTAYYSGLFMKSQQAVSEAVLTSELLGIRLRPTQTKCLTGVKVGTLSNPLFIISPQNSSTGIQTGKKMHSKKKICKVPQNPQRRAYFSAQNTHASHRHRCALGNKSHLVSVCVPPPPPTPPPVELRSVCFFWCVSVCV